MAINLQKGQTIDLRKSSDGTSEYDLSTVTVGLGWDMKVEKSKGFLGKLLGGNKAGADYDLDAVAFLLDENGKVADRGRTVQAQDGRQVGLHGGDVIFFNSMKHPSGHIWLTGDNLTGEGEGDDEQIIVKLNALDQRYQKIVFLVTIYQGQAKGQHFGLVDNAFIRAVDARGKEIARFTISGDPTYNGMCGMVFAEVYRKDGAWKFRALGDVKPSDSFVEILKQYT